MDVTARQTLSELTIEEVREIRPDIVLREKASVVQNVPNDQEVTILAIGTNTALKSSQKDALETAVEAITGVKKAKVLISGKSPSAANTPVGKQISMIVTGRFLQVPE